eukprot:GILI01016229.1.p1 GENE.GILI01016229.1~~GILI01016229.1.p1  ORF type:complete len:360 (-),score=85.83 GILI01016229.1:93-1172(-)
MAAVLPRDSEDRRSTLPSIETSLQNLSVSNNSNNSTHESSHNISSASHRHSSSSSAAAASTLLSSNKDNQDSDNGVDGFVFDRIGSPPISKELGEPIVVVRNISKNYSLAGREDRVAALLDINLNWDSEFYPIRRGEFVMIRGPSGGGKTTLLNILGTIDVPSNGTVELLGEKVDSRSSDSFLASLRLRKIGFVFQTFNLLATMSAYENVELPMTLLGTLSAKQRKQRAIELLTRVGLQDRLEHLPSELSGGEQQRVAIARALANSPELMLLDEPTGDLDTRSTVEVMDLLLNINQKGWKGDGINKTTFIMVTHNPDLECYADRILYVKDGKFERQVINTEQIPLDYETYLAYLNSTQH